MEAMFYLLPLLLLPLSLYLFPIIRRKASDDRKNLPPGSQGWPGVGENIKFGTLGPEKFIKERMEKHSQDIFQTSLLGEKVATFCGPKGNKFLFANENKLVTSWLPESLKKVLVFPEFVESNLKADSAFHRILHREVFTLEALKRYVPVMDALAREHMEHDWRPNSVVKVLPLSKKYTFELACRLLLGVADPVQIKKLSGPFTVVMKGIFSLPLNVPGTAYSRAIRGGKMVREELLRIIRERRMEKHEHEGTDLLSKMAVVRDEDGNLLSEKQISNDMIGVLVASFDTTSSAITNHQLSCSASSHLQ